MVVLFSFYITFLRLFTSLLMLSSALVCYTFQIPISLLIFMEFASSESDEKLNQTDCHLQSPDTRQGTRGRRGCLIGVLFVRVCHNVCFVK